MKVAIGIPHRSDIKIRTMLSLVANIQTIGCHSQLIVTSGPFVHWSREFIYEAAEKQECTHLVFVDTDMVFPPTAIRQLLDRDKDIIGIVARKKLLDPPLVCVRIKEGVEITRDQVPAEPFECEEVGTGLMAINMERTKLMQAPRFDAPAPRMDQPMPMGEDLYFCRKARAAGLEVWCDPTIDVKHIGDYEY